jgi:hypothetical protein
MFPGSAGHRVNVPQTSLPLGKIEIGEKFEERHRRLNGWPSFLSPLIPFCKGNSFLKGAQMTSLG